MPPSEDPRLANLSPSKRTAMALEGSPMFAPLEVKFKNMNVFTSSAKKSIGGRKIQHIISPNKDVRQEMERSGSGQLEETTTTMMAMQPTYN